MERARFSSVLRVSVTPEFEDFTISLWAKLEGSYWIMWL